jgi:DNA polymerase elongation subunit (family B)
MVISPQVGVHANVAVLDYDSEYPNIIVRNNISYETVMASRNVRNDADNAGLLPKVMKRYLSRRALFKQVMMIISKEAEQQSPQRQKEKWQWANQRAAALKTILTSPESNDNNISQQIADRKITEIDNWIRLMIDVKHGNLSKTTTTTTMA